MNIDEIIDKTVEKYVNFQKQNQRMEMMELNLQIASIITAHTQTPSERVSYMASYYHKRNEALNR